MISKVWGLQKMSPDNFLWLLRALELLQNENLTLRNVGTSCSYYQSVNQPCGLLDHCEHQWKCTCKLQNGILNTKCMYV